MQYPSTLIAQYPNASAFAEVATFHELAPGRKLTRSAVYQWRIRDSVPHMWRPVVRALLREMVETNKPEHMHKKEAMQVAQKGNT